VAAGAVVVDNSSAFRMDDGVPLVVADVNPHAAHAHTGVIANPNCSTMQLVPVLSALHRRSPLEHVTVATYQSVSGTGRAAVDALREQSAAVLAGEQPPAGVYSHRIAFNALPFAGSLSGDDGYTDEELKLVHESRKILELPDLRVSATCVRVPVMNSHSEAVWVRTRESIPPDEARALLAAEDGITVVDDPAAGKYPMAIDADGQDGVLVGRIRRDLGDPNALALWIVADNLRKGAATNAVQIAELLVRDSLLRSAA
jgi:aspartate-semialdehyde dehydrogenase